MPLEPREIKNKRKNNSYTFTKRDRNFGSIAHFQEAFPDSDSVLDFIFRARANKTFGGCSVCGMLYSSFQKVPGKLAYKCRCKKSPMIFPLSGTPFERFRKPLTLIRDIFYEMFCSKNGFPAAELDRRFQDVVKKNETSHLLLNRMSQTMGLAVMEKEFSPDAIIEVDEVYPKVETGLGPYYSFKRGLGSERIQPVVILTERRPKGEAGLTKAFVVEDVNFQTLKEIFRNHTKPTNTIYSDGAHVYNFLTFDEEFKDYFSQACNHKRKIWAEGDCHVNTVEGCNSFIKKTILSVYNGIKRPNTQMYVNRVVFNFSFWDEDIFKAWESFFSGLPKLNERIPNRVTCRRTQKKQLETKIKKWSKAA